MKTKYGENILMPLTSQKVSFYQTNPSGVEATPHSDRSSVSFATRVRRSYAWVWIMEQKDILTWPCVRLCTKTESVQVQVGSDRVKLQNPLQRQHAAKMSLFRALHDPCRITRREKLYTKYNLHLHCNNRWYIWYYLVHASELQTHCQQQQHVIS